MKIIARILFRIIFLVWRPKLKYIIFESVPDFSGSPFSIYEELIKKRYDSQYTMIWASNQNSSCTVDFFSSRKEKLKKIWILAHTKLIVDSNRGVSKINPRTFRLFTRHGGTLKKCDDYLHRIGSVDAVLSLSKEIADIDFGIFYPKIVQNRNQILELGMPANDMILQGGKGDLTLFWNRHFNSEKNTRFSKIIGWMPTFRQHQTSGDTVSTNRVFPYGLPLVYNLEQFNSLNSMLKKRNVLLAIQMHHAQQALFPNIHFSNIVLVSPEIKKECGVSNAELMKHFDALITDYSAAYYEYLLLDRPIAISIDDFEEYSAKIGFSINFYEFIRGHYLERYSDLLTFIENVSDNIDDYQAERHNAVKKIHKWTDNRSTERVLDYIDNHVRL